MDVAACMEQRKSCRGFLPKEVSRETLERILGAANRSPSYMNTQPWEVFAVCGEPKKKLAAKLYERASAGGPSAPDYPFPTTWPEAMDRRSKEHRLRRFKAVGVDPENQDMVRSGYLRNFVFFDAPCALFIGLDRSLTPWSVFDLGSFVHALLLAAHAEGLGGCPQALVMAYPEIVREELGVPESIALFLGISLGYPDPDARANQYRSLRRDPGEIVRWYGDWA
jgi:nitroreductase